MKYLFILFFFFSTLVGNSTSQNEKKTRVALLDFVNTGGIPQYETVTLTNRLRSMIVQTNAFIVLERGAMEEILDEQGFQQTGCTTTECAVELGKLLNVQKMISGSIGRLGNTYTIDLSLIDVLTAQIEKSFTHDYKGEIDGMLALMGKVASNIANIRVVKEEVILKKKMYNLTINSTPPTADVFINNRQAGKTPYKRDFEEGTALRIQLKKQNYKDWNESFTVNKNLALNPKMALTETYRQYLLNKKKELESKTKKPAIADYESSNLWPVIGAVVLIGGVTYLIMQSSE